MEDDGRGLTTGKDRIQHYGMTIMRERAQSLGGSVDVGNRETRGARMRLQFRRPNKQPSLELAHAR